MTPTRTLYRPVGARECELIAQSGFSRFPPRLPEQPIFYPVLTEEYAHQIARDWNAKEPNGVGYVTAFDVSARQQHAHVAGAAHIIMAGRVSERAQDARKRCEDRAASDRTSGAACPSW